MSVIAERLNEIKKLESFTPSKQVHPHRYCEQLHYNMEIISQTSNPNQLSFQTQQKASSFSPKNPPKMEERPSTAKNWRQGERREGRKERPGVDGGRVGWGSQRQSTRRRTVPEAVWVAGVEARGGKGEHCFLYS